MAEKYSYWNSSENYDNSGDDDFFAGYDEARIPVKVPEGTYIAILTGWKRDLNKNGNRCVKLSYRIASGDYSGQIVTEQRFLTEASMWYTKEFFDSMGINPRLSVSEYPEIWVELVTTVQDGADGRQYTKVQTVRRIVPPEGQTDSGQQSELPPGAF